MQVADGMSDLNGLRAEFVGGTDDGSLLHAAAGHEHGHGIGVVAATEGINAATFVVIWPEFTKASTLLRKGQHMAEMIG